MDKPIYIYIFILIYYIQPFYSDDEIVKVKRNRYLILNEITGAYLWGLRIHFDGQDVIYERIKEKKKNSTSVHKQTIRNVEILIQSHKYSLHHTFKRMSLGP